MFYKSYLFSKCLLILSFWIAALKIADSIDSIEIPITDCGGIVDNNGGIITMSNMSIPDEPRLFDCIWLIKPTFESTIRTHISVRVEMFNDISKKKWQHSLYPFFVMT